ncbi:glycoside hydrolase family 32 protein [Myroides pelagicus]|uniref:Glycoside hydrolase family 32 protein n=1 Tax=Myroides pelagicus TaxID=270914 RepID=A0A7K1GJ54_9FLAO|nr:glycoside hydrolase family 32 protein [Myroides pelagicus]MEC4113650.1 glycoside hydrolase family 32 protein [Myroides pelagicus]MTH28846.1 hypothetical protein [Myroides pelagicus]
MNYNTQISFVVENNFLLIPTNTKEEESILEIVDSKKKIILQFKARIDTTSKGDLLPIEISKHRGKELTLNIHSANPIVSAHLSLEQASISPKRNKLAHHPIGHLAIEQYPLGTPCGLFVFKNEYLLFSPYKSKDHSDVYQGWVVAKSSNLMHWRVNSLPLQLNPISTFKSSHIVLDTENISNLGKNTILAYFTNSSEDYSVYLAYKKEGDTSFIPFGNSILTISSTYSSIDGLKVTYHKQTSQWVMTICTDYSIVFYESKDLINWNILSEFKHRGLLASEKWKNPTLQTLRYGKQEKWVLLITKDNVQKQIEPQTYYFVGDFDGTTFSGDKHATLLPLDYGTDNAGGVIIHTKNKEKPIYIGYMSNPIYAKELFLNKVPSTMTYPRTLDLTKAKKQYVIASYTAKETKVLRVEKNTLSSRLLDKTICLKSILEDNNGTFELIIDFDIIDVDTKYFKLNLSNEVNEHLSYLFHFENNELIADRSQSDHAHLISKLTSIPIKGSLFEIKKYKVKLVIDKTSAELFINKGKVTMTQQIFPNEPYNTLTLGIENGAIDITKLNIYRLER